MEYNRIFGGFIMCKLLRETRYYGNNFVIVYWYCLSVLMKFDYLLSLSQSAQVRPASSLPRGSQGYECEH